MSHLAVAKTAIFATSENQGICNKLGQHLRQSDLMQLPQSRDDGLQVETGEACSEVLSQPSHIDRPFRPVA